MDSFDAGEMFRARARSFSLARRPQRCARISRIQPQQQLNSKALSNQCEGGERIKVCGLRLEAVARRLRRLFLGALELSRPELTISIRPSGRLNTKRPTGCVELQDICHLAASRAAGTPELPAAASLLLVLLAQGRLAAAAAAAGQLRQQQLVSRPIGEQAGHFAKEIQRRRLISAPINSSQPAGLSRASARASRLPSPQNRLESPGACLSVCLSVYLAEANLRAAQTQ